MTAPVGVVMARAAALERSRRQVSVARVREAKPRLVNCGWCGQPGCREHGDLDRLLAEWQNPEAR